MRFKQTLQAVGLRRPASLCKRAVYRATGLAVSAVEAFRPFRTPAHHHLPHRLQMLRGRYEPAETLFFRREARDARLVVDIGANIGYFTRLLATAGGPETRVVALEPNPVPFRFLERNTRDLPNVVRLPVGLSDTAGTVDLFTANDDTAVGTLAADVLHATLGPAIRLARTAVKLVRGDTLFAELGLGEPDLVKIDVEGWELDALRGLGGLPGRWRRTRILFEFNPPVLRALGHDPRELLGWWQQLGYRLCTLGPRGEPATAAPDTLAELSVMNGYCSLVARR